MTLPLLISMVVVAVSSVFPPKISSDGTSKATSTSGSSSSFGYYSIMPRFGDGNQAFFTGIALGIGLSWLVNHELERSRLHDRLRLAIQDLFRPLVITASDEDQAPSSGVTFSVLKNIHDKKQKGVNGGKQSTQQQNDTTTTKHTTTIISTDKSLTSSLWVSTICIPAQHRLKLQKAIGLEFFHVLQGRGQWGDDEDDNGQEIGVGDAFVVEANSMRWISNGSSSEDLILLRSSDAGHRHRQLGYDQIVPCTVVSTSTTQQLSSAMSYGYQYFFGSNQKDK